MAPAKKARESVYVNKKKYGLIEDWFMAHNNGSKPGERSLLLLTGPTGCGKTFLIHHISRTLNLHFISQENELVDINVRRKYNPLVFEQELDCLNSFFLYDDFSFSNSQITKPERILTSSALHPIIIIVTDPINGEPSMRIWLRKLLESPLVCHVEY